jgi:hypothetical protein
MRAPDIRSIVIVIVITSSAGCGDDAVTTEVDDGGADYDGGKRDDAGDAGSTFCQSSQALDLSVCDPKTAKFSLTIDNPFYPLVVGQTSVFEGEEDGEAVHLEVEVLDETETVAAIETRVIEERERQDGEIVEVSRNFFAQSENGTVCYFGEDVDIYEGGKIVAHEGEWRADGANRAGIVMPSTPKIGDFFAQEDAPELAEDRAQITAKNKPVSVPAGDFTDTLETTECSPLEPGIVEPKSYARGVGLLIDDVAKLVSY